MVRSSYALPLAISIVSFIGCSEGEDLPKLVPVTGTVTIDGEPALKTGLTFVPTEETPTASGYAGTESDGSYIAHHRSGTPGLEPGTYNVIFAQRLSAASPTGMPAPGDQSPVPADAKQLPGRYGNPRQPAITVTIPEEGGDFDFDLKTEQEPVSKVSHDAGGFGTSPLARDALVANRSVPSRQGRFVLRRTRPSCPFLVPVIKEAVL